MTANQIAETDAMGLSERMWLKEIAFQLAKINERASVMPPPHRGFGDGDSALVANKTDAYSVESIAKRGPGRPKKTA